MTPIEVLQAERAGLQRQLDTFNDVVPAYQALVAGLGSASAARSALRDIFKLGLLLAADGPAVQIGMQRLQTALQEQGLPARRQALIDEIAAIDAAIVALGG